MEKSFAKSNIALRRITDPSKYQPQIDPVDMDTDIYNDVSKNRDTFYAIFADDDNTVGLCCIRDDADAFLYIYIFPEYRHKGYGYLAACTAERQIQSSPLLSIATAYDSKNEIAKNFAEKCGFEVKSSSSVMCYQGEKFDIPELPIHKHRDEDFVEAYSMSAEAFHIMRLETGYFPDSVPFVPDEETRKYCLETADDRYIYFQGDEIVGCAQLDGAELSNVSIAISHQGKGLGRAFVKFLVNEILEKGIGEPFLYCIVGNRKARQLYDSLGFREIVRNVYATKKIAN